MRRKTVTAIMTIVILVLSECFKQSSIHNNNDDDLCVNVRRGSEKQAEKSFDSTDACVRVHKEYSLLHFQMLHFHI